VAVEFYSSKVRPIIKPVTNGDEDFSAMGDP
jgi:hypothetical protein